MNYIYVYDSQNQQKYKFSSLQTEGYDGVIRVANAYFAFDDTGAEMESGSSEFVVESTDNKLVFASNDYFDVYQSENMIGRFYVQNALKESMIAWRVQGIDALGKAEQKSIAKTYVNGTELSLYLLGLYRGIGENPIFGDETDQVQITITENNQVTLRELSQKIALGLGVNFTTANTKTIKINIAPSRKIIDRRYNTSELFDSAVVSDKEKFNGTIRVYKTYVDGSSESGGNAGSEYSYGIWGYAPIGQNIILTLYYNPIIDVKPTVDGEKYTPYNGFFKHAEDNILLASASASSETLRKGHKVSEYLTAAKTYENCIRYSIDQEALDTVYADCGEGKYIDENGNEYAYIDIDVYRAKTKQEEIGTVTNGTGGEERELILPCGDVNTYSRIRKSFRRTKEIQYSCLYRGEQLGEIVKIPDLWESGEYAIIKKLELDFSANNIFATITADILSNEEVENIRYDGAEYGDDTEYGDGTEYGGYEIYEEVQ